MADRSSQNRPTLQPQSDWSAASEYGGGEVMPYEQGGRDVDVSVQGSIITAQRVAKPRNLQKVMHDIGVLAKMNGHRYVYSWEQNDRKNNRKVTISGPTIKLANDLVRVYGNCVVDVHAEPGKDYTMFYARFVDLETGFSLTRAFRQRSGQKLGMGDAEREEDIKFQIGQSKAIRNVVTNALSTLVDYAVEEADSNLLAWVDNNPQKAAQFVERVTAQNEIDMQRVEAVIGRPQEKWTSRDYARAMTELRGIDEGLVSADDAFPSQEDAKQVTASKDRERQEGKKQQSSSGGQQQSRSQNKSQSKSGGQKKQQQEKKDDGASAKTEAAAGAGEAAASATEEAPQGDTPPEEPEATEQPSEEVSEPSQGDEPEERPAAEPEQADDNDDPFAGELNFE
jgi:hypothetical protein